MCGPESCRIIELLVQSKSCLQTKQKKHKQWNVQDYQFEAGLREGPSLIFLAKQSLETSFRLLMHPHVEHAYLWISYIIIGTCSHLYFSYFDLIHVLIISHMAAYHSVHLLRARLVAIMLCSHYRDLLPSLPIHPLFRHLVC